METLNNLLSSEMVAFRGLFTVILSVIMAHAGTSIVASLIKVFVLKKGERMSKKEFYEFLIDVIRYIALLIFSGNFTILVTMVYHDDLKLAHMIGAGAVLYVIIAAVAIHYICKNNVKKADNQKEVTEIKTVEEKVQEEAQVESQEGAIEDAQVKQEELESENTVVDAIESNIE